MYALEIFCLDLFIFHKAEVFEWFEIHKILLMTWAVGKHCLEINVI